MRLKKINLAGFKSFVDPTTVLLQSNRVAIVGPNGCGKSNVIDAVRWVLGESSAKQLRGESMADVIFSGSTARAPVGQASVELSFDNSDGSLGGEYAAFNEIAIKRIVTRDGKSDYFLNNARCRRKDITDIFLGTGLGPRSYAIIEQGMISRLIEAKPEDLRIFLEETAGISKYKERRRETETRIRHTEENLERLSDLREEIAKQLTRLEKQAEAAEKYKELKKSLRQVSAEHFALKWRVLDTEMTAKHRELAEREIQVDKEISVLREIDAQIENQRVTYDSAQENLQKVQSDYYRSAAQVAKHEQALEHQRERQAQLDMDLAQIAESFEELQQALTSDQEQHESIQAQIAKLTPESSEFENQYKNSYQALTHAEGAMQTWQKNWEILNQQLAHEHQKAFVAQEKLTHLQDNINSATQRLQALTDQYSELTHTDLAHTISAMHGECQASAQQLLNAKNQVAHLQQQLQTQQADNERVQQQLDTTREELQSVRSEAVSIQALQHAAFGQQQEGAKAWLANHALDDKQRLAQQLVVEPKWICAVETVLGHYLQAICVDKLEQFMENLAGFADGSLVLFENKSEAPAGANLNERALLNKIKTPLAISHLLSGIYYAESLAEALIMRGQLGAQESVVTPEGIWLSQQWVRVARSVDQQAGVLAREQRLQVLEPRIQELQNALQSLQDAILSGKEQAKALAEQSSKAQQDLNQFAHVDADLQAQHRALQVRQQELLNQKEKMTQEMAELEQRIAQQQQQLAQTREIHEEAQGRSSELAEDKIQLEQTRNELTESLQQAKNKAHNDQENSNRVQMQLSGLTHRLEATQTHLQRAKYQLEKLQAREDQLNQARTTAEEPLEIIAAELEAALEQQVKDESLMQDARGHVDLTAHQLRAQEQARLQSEERASSLRSVLEEYRLAEQTIRVKRDGVAEQLQTLELQLEEILKQLPEDAQVADWEHKEERINAHIKRLGAINLAAIDEYAEHAERLQYLDKQDEDLRSALNTLQEAMEKIDKETKQRFKETFDAVNEGLGRLFTQVFGGGHASLELTENDLLNTGVTIMAQPPGKRNSTIHALSGGEKALTALSLVFSMFRLNPAPFCMLDEVDAPLDDANVGRFARLVKDMSEHIQFIFITHNKGTMEIADHLMGVTMKEAGVSRLVSVDVEKATELGVA
ncbi:MAG: chromosome segregation protein SMC [Legionellales bacterium]|jgi:chromosome segregation protein